MGWTIEAHLDQQSLEFIRDFWISWEETLNWEILLLFEQLWKRLDWHPRSLTVEAFPDHATARKDIDVHSISFGLMRDLWGLVQRSTNRGHSSVGIFAHDFGETVVTDLVDTSVDDHVGWLDVSMHDFVLVEISKATDTGLHDSDCFVLRDFALLLDHTFNITASAVLHDDVELGLGLVDLVDL